MGENSKIEWTDHTFNPWRGCTKISAGCTNCYAETLSHRNPGILGIWGDKGTRVVAAESAWREPLKWDRKAKAEGVRRRVFCASLADVFEDREEFIAPRERLFDLIDETPNLDWLLLTKRPENLNHMLPWCRDHAGEYRDRFWPNVWLGTSVENQEAADKRIPHLLKTPAAVRFLSMEPLLGPVDLSPHILCRHCDGHEHLQPKCGPAFDWVIVGGESGPNARPMHPDWARSIRDQCVAAGVAFHFKQWGEWADFDNPYDVCNDPRYVRKNMQQVFLDGKAMNRVGKKAAGRMLDGRTWDELPEAAHA